MTAATSMALPHPAPAGRTGSGEAGTTPPAQGGAGGVGTGMHPFTRLRGLIRPDRGDIFAVTLYAVAIGILLLATPIAVQALVNFVALGGALPPLLVVASLLFLGLFFAGLLLAAQAWAVERLQRRVFVRLVGDLAARLPRVDQRIHDERHAPELVNRFFDVLTIQKVGSFLLLDGLSILLSVLVGLVVLAFYHPLLLAFDIVLLVIIAALVFGPLRKGTRSALVESKSKYEVVSWFEEVARNPHVFKAGGAEHWVEARADGLAHKYLDARAAHFRVVFSQIVGALSLQVVASTALLGIGGFLVMDGALTLGQLVAAELIVTVVVGSVAKMGKHLEGYYDLMAATDKVGQLIDLPAEADSGETLPAGATEGTALDLVDVSWTRPHAPPLFDGLNLRVEPGERLGITGPSGAGKSLLLELLWGLRPPPHGSLRIDGVDLRELAPRELRRHSHLVADPIEIVVGTLRENVTLGRPHVTDEDIRVALEAVGLTDRVGLLPDGLDSPLHSSGHPLTGGEVRRLVLARALADSPRLLMVQDVLDHLDPEAREELCDTLFDPERRHTLLVVSNSSEVLSRCDRVLELGTTGRLEPASAPTAGGTDTDTPRRDDQGDAT